MVWYGPFHMCRYDYVLFGHTAHNTYGVHSTQTNVKEGLSTPNESLAYIIISSSSHSIVVVVVVAYRFRTNFVCKYKHTN